MRIFLALGAAGAIALSLAPAVRAAGALRLDTIADGALEIRSGGARAGEGDLVARLTPKTPAARRGAARLREVLVDDRRLAELRIPVRGTAGEEVWIGEAGPGDHRVIWSGQTGPRDADGETAIWVEVTPERVLQYQTSETVTRCDGQPPRLFPKVYDFAAGRFRPIFSPAPPPAGQRLVARRRDPAMPSGAPSPDFHWVAASTTRAAGDDARALTPPVELDDGKPATVWAEGLGGDGRGEFLTARAAAAGYAVRGLRIFPGDGASLAAFRARNRVKRFQVALGPAPGQRFDVELDEDPAADPARWREPFWVSLPQPLQSSCVTVVVTEVVPGTDAAPPRTYGTTAIGDLAIFTDADGPDRVSRLVGDLAAASDCASRLPLVVGLGTPAVQPTAEAARVAKGAGRECLLEALAALEPEPKTPIVLEALTAAVIGATAGEERLLSTLLRRAPAPPVAPLARLLTTPAAAMEDRARAARLLGVLDSDQAFETLLAAAGQGPPPLRGEVVDALVRSPRLSAAATLAAFSSAPSGEGAPVARAADLARVLPSAVRRDPAGRTAVVAALRTALGPDRAFEVRGRAVLALGALGPEGDPGALEGLRRDSTDPVLRFLAIRELGDLPVGAPTGGADPRPALRAALTDVDPRVRETAALGLAKQKDLGAAAILIDGAKQEPWPFVRRAEVEALGQLCAPGAADLLVRAIERDVDDVRRAALGGLAHCRDSRARDVLLRVLGRRNENASLRSLAAGLLAASGDPGVVAPMAAALHRAVVESEADLAVEGVVVAVLRALARLGGPDAVAAAVTLAGDARHPFRLPAVEVLGTLCDAASGAATLRVLAGGPDPSLARAAAAAERRCAPTP